MEGFGLEAEARMTTWHVPILAENEPDAVQSHDVSEGETPPPVTLPPVSVQGGWILESFKHGKTFCVCGVRATISK